MPQSSPHRTRLLLNIEEIAEVSGLSASTVRWHIHTQKLPSVKVGRRRLVRRADVASYLGVSIEDLRS